MYAIFKKLLEEHNVRASDVSKATGIRQSTFADWKAGRYEPKADKMKLIADYFGVTPEYLATGKTSEEGYYINPETAKVAQEIFESKELRILFDAARDASPEDLRTTYRLLMDLKNRGKE